MCDDRAECPTIRTYSTLVTVGILTAPVYHYYMETTSRPTGTGKGNQMTFNERLSAQLATRLRAAAIRAAR